MAYVKQLEKLKAAADATRRTLRMGKDLGLVGEDGAFSKLQSEALKLDVMLMPGNEETKEEADRRQRFKILLRQLVYVLLYFFAHSVRTEKPSLELLEEVDKFLMEDSTSSPPAVCLRYD